MACNRSSRHWPSGYSEICGRTARDDRAVGEDKRPDNHNGIGSRYSHESDANHRNFHRDKVKKIEKVVEIGNLIHDEKLMSTPPYSNDTNSLPIKDSVQRVFQSTSRTSNLCETLIYVSILPHLKLTSIFNRMLGPLHQLCRMK